MIPIMESGDKCSMLERTSLRTSESLAQLHSPDDLSSLHLLLSELNIPFNCLDNPPIRQHYIEEYSAKYSKAKYLLSNARKKQRKIIIAYHEAKEKRDNPSRLQAIKESLLDENEKIKKFKEALKNKLILYQQRIQFLKDAEFWSAGEAKQWQKSATEASPIYAEKLQTFPNSPLINESLHLLHDHEEIEYTDYVLDDSCRSNVDEIDDSKPSVQLNDHESDIISQNHRRSRLIDRDFTLDSTTHVRSPVKVDVNITGKRLMSRWFRWLAEYREFLFNFTFTDQYDWLRIISMMVLVSLSILLIVFINDLLEYLLVYLTKTSTRTSPLSRSVPTSKSSFFSELLSNIYQWTISWLLPVFRSFERSV